MRSYRCEAAGDLDGLREIQEEALTPAAGQVLVQVKASSLNFRDFALVMGWFPGAGGRIPLSDGAGEVTAVGAGVTRFQAGDRVVGAFYPTWFGGRREARHPCYGTDRDGWLTEQKVVDAEALSPVPAHLDYAEASTLPCAGVTAWSALAGIGPGDTVLTQGSGGVSLFALQLARLAGARVIVTTTRADKADKLKALGASDVIDVKAEPEWDVAVRRLLGGPGADRVVEIGGPGTLARSVKAVRYGGQVSLVGALASGPGTEAGVDFMPLFLSQATYQPIGTGSRADLEALGRAVAAHQLHPVIDRIFDWSEVRAAWQHFAGRSLIGKVVIRHA